MKLVLHPDYKHLEGFIKQLPQTFKDQGKVLYNYRNEIRLIEVEGIKLVVKKFKVPHYINRLAYSFLRKSKACRSYQYSLELISKGFGAAIPIAFSEYKKGGLLHDSYYISLFCPLDRDFNEFRGRNIDGRESILRDFAQFTADLHQAGILHLDYGGGNILFKETENGTEFCLLDVNRMKKGKVSLRAGCQNFKLLYMLDETFTYLITEYAKIRKYDIEKCQQIIAPFIQKQ